MVSNNYLHFLDPMPRFGLSALPLMLITLLCMILLALPPMLMFGPRGCMVLMVLGESGGHTPHPEDVGVVCLV